MTRPVADFCELNFGVTVPLFAKIDVNGDGAAPALPLAAGRAAASSATPIEWNFTKFLIAATAPVRAERDAAHLGGDRATEAS